jgi:hypothetical protein
MSNLTGYRDPLATIVALSVEGVRRFGDDPKSIAAFIDAEIDSKPLEERRRLRQGLSLVAAPVDGIGQGD